MLFRKRSNKKQTPQSPSPAEEDVLLLLEEEAFRKTAEARAKALPPSLAEPTSAEVDALEIAWDDSEEGVYHPESVESTAYLRNLPESLRPKQEPLMAVLFIRRQAWKDVLSHLGSNLKVEQGGLLLGRALHDTAKSLYILIIEQTVVAPEGVETTHSFSYTSETWQAIFPSIQQMPENWTILGSYHSHPNMGVFLSKTDLATQADIFSHPWQIAVVVDPVRNEAGFFVGVEGTRCPHWCVAPDGFAFF